MRYNNTITMQDMFANPSMADALPQFDRNTTRLSLPEIQERIGAYIETLYQGQRRMNGDIVVVGEHAEVMRNIQSIAPNLQTMFGNMEMIGQAMQNNVALYTPFTSPTQAATMNTPEQRASLLSVIAGNLAYNPDIAQPSNDDTDYKRRQLEWLLLVGHPLYETFRRRPHD